MGFKVGVKPSGWGAVASKEKRLLFFTASSILMRKEVILAIGLGLAVALVILYILTMRQATSSPTPTPTPTASPLPVQFPIYQQYTVAQSSGGNVVIPLLTDNFVVSVKPVTTTSLMAWFNITNDQYIHDDSLIIIPNLVTITQETPILFSSTLKQQNVPFEGYGYLVLSLSAPATIKVSFTE